MKITKFAQSCILVETNGQKILIDPGNLEFQESYLENEWKNIDVLLVTHKHDDHCDKNIIQKILENDNPKFFSSQEVVDAFPNLATAITVVKAGDILKLENLKIEVTEAVHGYVPYFRGDYEIHENIGFIIDDNENRIYHTSDIICFKNDYKCDVLIVPVVGHGLVMGSWEAALFSKETNAKLIIPCHYDHPKHPANFKEIKKDFEDQNLNYKILEIGESMEINN